MLTLHGLQKSIAYIYETWELDVLNEKERNDHKKEEIYVGKGQGQCNL